MLLTIVGQRFRMSGDYVAALERRLSMAEKRAEDAEGGHDKCDEDKEALKRVIEASERERSRLERDNYDLLEELRQKERQIRSLGGTPQ